MKQKDLALVLVVAFMSAVFSILISNLLITGSDDRNQKAEVVEAIVADFPEPPEKYFNENSIDPTQLIRIGDTTNPSPFNAN